MKSFGWKLVVVSLFVSSVASACSAGNGSKTAANESNQPASSASPKAAAPQPGINEPVELVFYTDTGMPDAEFNDKIRDPLKKKFPMLTVKYTVKSTGFLLEDLVAAGNTVDITWDGSFTKLSDLNLAYDMSDLVKQANIDLSSFDPNLIDASKTMSSGKLYGLPVLMDSLILYYNKDIFDKFGVPYLKNGMTWDDVLEIGKKLTATDSGKQYAGLAVSLPQMLRLNQFSQAYVDSATNKATLASDNWKKVIDKLVIQPAASDGYRSKIEQLGNKIPNLTNFLKDQDLAMFARQASMILATPPDQLNALNWDMVSLPTFKELPNIGSQLQPYFFSITSQSKHKEQAMLVIKYLTSEEYQLEWAKKGAPSPLKSDTIQKSYGVDSLYKTKNWSALSFNKSAAIRKTIYDSQAEAALNKQMVDLATGRTDLNTALKNAEDEANSAIQQAKAK